MLHRQFAIDTRDAVLHVDSVGDGYAEPAVGISMYQHRMHA
jgi:hypothetical protein